MSEWRVVIPSAGRGDVVARRSLAVLDRSGIEPERVTIYVANIQERTNYAFDLPARWRARLGIADHDPTWRSLDDIGVRPHTVGAARNAILDQATPGERLVFMDDDLGSINRKIGPQDVEPIDKVLVEWIDLAFAEMDRQRSAIWGVYPAPNAFFMRERIRTDLVHIPAGFHGIEYRGEPWQRVTLDSKEEFERSIRYYLATGRSCRFDSVCMGTHGYAGRGGLQMSRTHASAARGCEWLVNEFPDLCTINTTKKSGWVEVRLKDRRPR